MRKDERKNFCRNNMIAIKGKKYGINYNCTRHRFDVERQTNSNFSLNNIFDLLPLLSQDVD